MELSAYVFDAWNVNISLLNYLNNEIFHEYFRAGCFSLEFRTIVCAKADVNFRGFELHFQEIIKCFLPVDGAHPVKNEFLVVSVIGSSNMPFH